MDGGNDFNSFQSSGAVPTNFEESIAELASNSSIIHLCGTSQACVVDMLLSGNEDLAKDSQNIEEEILTLRMLQYFFK